METLRLIVRDSEQKSTTYVLDKEQIAVGRGAENDVILDHPSVSRHHVRIERKARKWYMVDLESTNGTSVHGVTLTPYRPQIWRMPQEAKVGDFTLMVQSTETLDEPTQVELTMAERTALQRDRAQLTALSLNPPKSEVVIGETVSVLIPVRNNKPTVQSYEIQLSKMPTSWSTLSEWRIQVDPNMHQVVRLSFHPPRDGSVESGKYPYEVTLRELDGPIVGVKRGEVVVKAAEKFAVQLLTPEPLRSGQTCVVRVTNLGDTPGIYQLLQPSGPVVFANPYETILLQAGVWNDISLLVSARNRPIFGRTQRLPFEFKVANQKQVIESISAQLLVRPLLPLWIPLVLLLLVLLFFLLRAMGLF